MGLWGPRTLTQILFARLCWDAHAPVAEIHHEYLLRFYGPAAAPMGDFYDHLQSAYANITAWRSWLHTSVNTNLLHWDGQRPTKPLFRFKHLQAEGGECIGARDSLVFLDKAGEALQSALRMDVPLSVRLRLEEDARQFRYGDDSFRFYAAMAQLYEADRQGDNTAVSASWRDVQRYAESLRSYVVPFSWEDPGPGFWLRTACNALNCAPYTKSCATASARTHKGPAAEQGEESISPVILSSDGLAASH